MSESAFLTDLQSDEMRQRIAAIVDRGNPAPEVREAAIDAIMRWLRSIGGDESATGEPGSDDEAIQRQLSLAAAKWML